MLDQIVRVVVRVLVSAVLGAAAGALYAGLVGAVHLGAYGRWDQIPAFAVGCVLVGAVLGLLGRVAWALSGEAVRERADCQSPPSGSRHPGSARGTADEVGRGRGRQPDRAGDHAAGEEHPVYSGRFAWLCRGFETRN
jgi:hypothetical protein